MRPARRALSVLVAITLGIAGSVTPARADTPEFQVFHSPPGLILRGQAVFIHAFVETTDFGPPTEAFAFVRDDPSEPFARLRLFDSTRRVPDRFLDGGFLEDYVVVQDSGTDRTLRVPPSGAYRSWIRDSFPEIDLGRHRFGHVRPPGAIVA